MSAEPAGWAWLIILGIVIGFEVWAVSVGAHTLSQWLWRHPVLKWLGIAALSGFILHMVFYRETPVPHDCGEECEGACDLF